MSKTTLDLSTLPGIAGGTHNVKVKAKAAEYIDSEFSNEVSYVKIDNLNNYQPVEYISSKTNNNYIVTPYIPNGNTIIKMKGSRTNGGSWFGVGYYPEGSSTVKNFHLTGGNKVEYTLRYGTSNDYPYSRPQPGLYTLYHPDNPLVEIEFGATTIFNGRVVRSIAPVSMTFNHSMPIFGRWNPKSSSYDDFATGELYYLQIWEGKVKLYDFIPCYRKTDNVIGLYEQVNQVFYTNNGKGAFERGPDITINYNFKAMSFNVCRWSGLNGNTDLLDSLFSDYDVDIAGFQEDSANGIINGDSAATYLKSKFAHVIFSEPTVGDWFRKAIASKYELANHMSIQFTQPSAESGLEIRSYHKAYISWSGKNIAIYNTHLHYIPPSTPDVTSKIHEYLIPEVKQLIADMSQEPYFILLADSNIDCPNNQTPFYTLVAKLFVDAGFNMSNWSSQFGYYATCFDSSALAKQPCYVDTVITSSNIDIVKLTVDTRKIGASSGTQAIDHLPVIAYLNIDK